MLHQLELTDEKTVLHIPTAYVCLCHGQCNAGNRSFLEAESSNKEPTELKKTRAIKEGDADARSLCIRANMQAVVHQFA